MSERAGAAQRRTLALARARALAGAPPNELDLTFRNVRAHTSVGKRFLPLLVTAAQALPSRSPL